MNFDLQGQTKADVIKEMVDLTAQSSLVRDREELLAAVFEREKLVTTGVGYGVAFPHAKTRAMKGIVIVFGRSEVGIDFEAMDKKPVHLLMMIAAPEDAIGAHLNVMARLSYIMKSEKNRERLMRAKTAGEVMLILDSAP
jgi:mannitol/fructose-specific phosphotransferase system IIA component (Ntr-type)